VEEDKLQNFTAKTCPCSCLFSCKNQQLPKSVIYDACCSSFSWIRHSLHL